MAVRALRVVSAAVEHTESGAPVEGTAVVDVTDALDRDLFGLAVSTGGPVSLHGIEGGPFVVRLSLDETRDGGCRWRRDPGDG